MKNNQLTLWVIGGIGVLALAIFFFSSGGDTQAGSPSFKVNTEEIELGEIAVQGDYPADFTVTNTGDAPLEISKVRTSCMCTLAEIMIGDTKSMEFNMDMPMGNYDYIAARKWKGVIEPGQSATVRVIYKPHLMPVQGSVSRNVKFSTNDPNNSVVELGIHATVK